MRRARSTSRPRVQIDNGIPVPADLMLRTLAANGTRTVSDAAVSPKPLQGGQIRTRRAGSSILNGMLTSASWTSQIKGNSSVFCCKRMQEIGFRPYLTRTDVVRGTDKRFQNVLQSRRNLNGARLASCEMMLKAPLSE
jgi:hypothetical protein